MPNVFKNVLRKGLVERVDQEQDIHLNHLEDGIYQWEGTKSVILKDGTQIKFHFQEYAENNQPLRQEEIDRLWTTQLIYNPNVPNQFPELVRRHMFVDGHLYSYVWNGNNTLNSVRTNIWPRENFIHQIY